MVLGEPPVRHLLDSSFRYKPSFDTDVRKTFERVRRQQQVSLSGQSQSQAESQGADVVRINVLQLDQLEKASSS